MGKVTIPLNIMLLHNNNNKNDKLNIEMPLKTLKRPDCFVASLSYVSKHSGYITIAAACKQLLAGCASCVGRAVVCLRGGLQNQT